MFHPTAPGGPVEIDDPPTGKHAKEHRLGERSYFTPADLTLTTRRPSSTEVVAALSAPPRAFKPDYVVRPDRNRPATAIEASLKNALLESGVAWPRATREGIPRPLALIPRRKRPLPAFLRPPERVSLMGVRIDCVTERHVIKRVISSIRDGRGGWIVTPNVDHLRIICQRPELGAMLGEATLMVADGMPLVWASRLQGFGLPERVTGAGLILSMTAAARQAGASIFLMGGEPGDGEAAAAVLRRSNPGLKIAGVISPPLGFENDPLQMAEIGNALHLAKPDLVFSCFGFPKQEFVIHALRHRLPSAWFLGLGGSLAIVSGRTRRAPRWMQNVGMEWLWRLGLEPRRLFHRYIVDDLPFAIRLLANALAQR